IRVQDATEDRALPGPVVAELVRVQRGLQTSAVESRLPETSRSAPAKATLVVSSTWPSSFSRTSPFDAFQTRTLRSPALASEAPSGEKATAVTGSCWKFVQTVF